MSNVYRIRKEKSQRVQTNILDESLFAEQLI